MAKYTGSPWGQIRGKLGPVVGTKAPSGTKVVRIFTNPHPNPSINHYFAKVVWGILHHIIKQKYSDLIYPVWKTLTKNSTQLPLNLFIKKNMSSLYHSIKNYHPQILSTLIISDGTAEETPILHATYNKKTAILKVNWNTKTFRNGSSHDHAYLAAIHWKPDNSKKSWKSLKIWGNALYPLTTRKHAQTSIKLEKNLEQTQNFIVYLFFKSNHSFSYSTSLPISLISSNSLIF